jgi:Trm5-related predicted tRNA methylase
MTRDELARIAIRVLAEQTARKRIKEQLRQRGVKLSYVSAKDIIAQAKAWLAAHPEMIAEARAKAVSLGYGADI